MRYKGETLLQKLSRLLYRMGLETASYKVAMIDFKDYKDNKETKDANR